MNREKKLELLAKQIADANDGRPVDLSLWRETSGVVLRNVLGDANPLYGNFTSIRYVPAAFSTDTPQSHFDAYRVRAVQKAVAIMQAARLEVELSGGSPEPQSGGEPAGGGSIFVVHGRDGSAKHETARFLARLTGNEPTILHEQGNEGRVLIEKFEDFAKEAAYAVVLATGDDVGRVKGTDTTHDSPRARQNVVFELGFFFGALGRRRVALLCEEGLERPSDTDGIVRIEIDAAGAWKMLLARELAAAGIGVDWSALQ